MTPFQIVEALWLEAGLPRDALDHLSLTGEEPALPSSLRVGAAAQASIAAAALAAAETWHRRGEPRQGVSVDLRHAAVEFRSERYLRIDGKPAPELWDDLAGAYPCRDGWVRVHTNFPHHRDGLLALLDCPGERAAVAEALARRDAESLETEAAAAGLVVAMLRRPEAWAGHPQGRAVASLPLLTIEKLDDTPPEPLPSAGTRPLDALRVLDLTRIIAGPVCGRALAAHGAEVLRLTADHLPSVPPLVVDTGRGKRSARLDLRQESDKAALRGLIAGADIFAQGYRPGALAARGFGPAALAALRPGLIVVSLSAYGHAGPWRQRRGFDSLVQTANGINVLEAEAAGTDRPKPLPCQALDHASGYLMAFGALVALLRRAEEGGSWHVQVSLARTGRWLTGLGRLPDGLACPDPGFDDVADLLEESASGFGALTAVRHAGRLAATPPFWAQPSMPLGSHPPAWPTELAQETSH